MIIFSESESMFLVGGLFKEDSEDVESEVSEEPNTPLNPVAAGQMYDGNGKDDNGIESPVNPSPAGPSRKRAVAKHRKNGNQMQWSESVSEEPINMTKGDYNTNNHESSYDVAMSPSCNGFAKREASSTPDNLSAGTKDDDDEDDDDDTDKIDINKYDPERLKAFNMFVRLFVDENLDRIIPISRQPKDKIQAIIDSCTRQFPEFGERARKRIRTKRNSQPHLTSALAEQILANACENESQNAKRMRLGLKPVSAEVERPCSETPRSPPQETIPQSTPRQRRSETSSQQNGTQTSSTYTYRLVPNATTNGNPSSVANASNGPTDLSMKKVSTSQISNNPPSPPHQSLNSGEVIAVKQLIAGYRESAAFLLRSADELEQLLLQQN
ncbi:nucleolar protein 4-like [Caerostris extrusa]|uniref:Nucleolar protein 4-like n=1 Tax=Caerostris extrusa TaxID=172846 RepID=A0AAV4SGY8_CAEEX|nr:nucleolar protein 4-like [Caerostris extrusa]